MVKWEYMTLLRERKFSSGEARDWNIDIGPKLAELGNAGWELVVVVPRCDKMAERPNVGSNAPLVIGPTTSDLWVFKRPKE